MPLPMLDLWRACPGPGVFGFLPLPSAFAAPMFRIDPGARFVDNSLFGLMGPWICIRRSLFGAASLAQLAEHALRKRTVTGSIPVGGCVFQSAWRPEGAG